MGFKCGIVGLPNVGKSTLFNALTQTAAAQAANYPFCTIEPNVGEVAVPDPRLDALAAHRQVRARSCRRGSTFVDIAGLVRGASKGEGLGNQFLANIREVDAIAHVVRCFEDDDVTHVEGRIDPVADIETIETELMLADLDSLEKRVDRAREEGQGRRQGSGEGGARPGQAGARRCCATASRRASSSASPRRRSCSTRSALLTSQAGALRLQRRRGARPRPATTCRARSRRAPRKRAPAASSISAKIEAEIAALPAEERASFLADLGLEGAGPRPADPRRLRAAAIS